MFKQGMFAIDPNATPDQIAKKRALIASMMPRFGSAKYVGEGLGQLATGVVAGRQNRKLNDAETAGNAEAKAFRDRILGGVSGGASGGGYSGGGSPSGTWTPDAPPPKPTESFMGKQDVVNGGLSFGLPAADTGIATGGLDYGANVMTPQEMLIAGAEARGLDPIDVATAISYETGGKFDPTIKGPTTQWGTHEGLIQFGDPQGQEHGAVFDQGADTAWRSQLDPTNGAVWSYLDSVGVKPGMGLDKIYSGINAGGVNRGGASDANNGGAPGTVADKVAGMGDHRVKASEFLGGTWTPNADAGASASTKGGAPSGGGAPPQIPLNDLYAILSDPWQPPEVKAMVQSMISEQQAASDPLRQLELEKAQLELDAMRNPGKPEPIEVGGVLLDPVTMQPIFDSRTPPDAATSIEEYEYYKQGAVARGETPMPYEAWTIRDEQATVPPGAPPGLPPDEEALRGSLGKKEGETWAGYLDGANTSAGTMQDMEMLDELITMAPQGPITGRLAGAFTGYNSSADAFTSVVKRVAPTLRAPGSGATSDVEYEGMLKSLPQLSANPEANKAISAMIKAKAAINIERGKAVAAYQNGEISAQEARSLMAEINGRSIMTPELQAILAGTAAPQPGSDMSDDDAAYLRSLGIEP